MPPSFDDSSFIVVGDLMFEDDDDGLSTEYERDTGGVGGTLILPSATSSPETFTPPSSVDSDIASLDLNHKRLLVPDDEDDDMEGIDDPLLDCSPPNVDADMPSSEFHEESATNASWKWKRVLQEFVPQSTTRRSILFFYLPVLVAVLGIAAYTKHADRLRLREIEMANQLREREHQQRILQLQQEIENLKKQHSGFTFTIPDPTVSWLTLDSAEATTRSIITQWTALKTSASTTVNTIRQNFEKDLQEAKEWWNTQQQLVIEKVNEDTSRFPDDTAPSDEEAGTDAADTKGKSLMPSKKTILVSAAVVTVASVILGTAVDALFGHSASRIADYDTFDPFGVPLADFVE